MKHDALRYDGRVKFDATAAPAIALDGRWLLHLYDKNYTRTEMMIRKPVQTPCCSPNLDDIK